MDFPHWCAFPTVSSAPPRLYDCPRLVFPRSRRIAGRYLMTFQNESVLEFSCMKNYHLVAGSLVSHCLQNGSWSGKEPMCMVDFFMEKTLLSTSIIAIVILVFAIFLAVDYSSYMNRRDLRKEEKKWYKLMHDHRRSLVTNERLLYPSPSHGDFIHHGHVAKDFIHHGHVAKEMVRMAGLQAVSMVRDHMNKQNQKEGRSLASGTLHDPESVDPIIEQIKREHSDTLLSSKKPLKFSFSPRTRLSNLLRAPLP